MKILPSLSTQAMQLLRIGTNQPTRLLLDEAVLDMMRWFLGVYLNDMNQSTTIATVLRIANVIGLLGGHSDVWNENLDFENVQVEIGLTFQLKTLGAFLNAYKREDFALAAEVLMYLIVSIASVYDEEAFWNAMQKFLDTEAREMRYARTT